MGCILGLDPGLAHTGYGMIEVTGNKARYLTHGVIETASDSEPGERLAVIHDAVSLLLDRYRPELAGIETLYFARNRSSALPVSQARGVLLLTLHQKGVRVFESSPQEIKQALTGSGRAEKQQVWEMVRVLLGLKSLPGPDHATDALAAAICCFHLRAASARGIR